MPESSMLIYGGIFAVMIIFGLASFYINRKQNQARQTNYLAKYPDAVKVWMKTTNMLIVNSKVSVYTVDGEVPAYFNGGCYVKPGKSVLNVQYEAERPGITHRKVTTYTDRVNVEVDLEPNKEYTLLFDKDLGQFRTEVKA